MNILVDVSAGRAVAAALRTMGHGVTEVQDRDPQLLDVDILTWAVNEGRLVLTMDKDFGELVYRSNRPHAGVLLLRLDAARTAEKIQVLTEIFRDHAADLPNRFSVYQDGRLRVR